MGAERGVAGSITGADAQRNGSVPSDLGNGAGFDKDLDAKLAILTVDARVSGSTPGRLQIVRHSARLLRDQGRSVKAVTLLQPVYDRFTEGFDTADLIAAKQLLAELGDTTPD
jgi:hypothetical protein